MARTPKSPALKTVLKVRSERVIEAGPRGFRFGRTWLRAVKACAGIAVHPTYLPKLKAHAKQIGVSYAGKDPKVICQRIAEVL